MKPAAISCVYDWVEGSEGVKLQCQTHKGDCHTVFVMLLPDHSTLLDMLHLGILQGRALTDAETLASAESWLTN
jgi:hypothetical protein